MNMFEAVWELTIYNEEPTLSFHIKDSSNGTVLEDESVEKCLQALLNTDENLYK